MTRFTPAGAVDTTWANNGTKAFPFDTTANIPYAILVSGSYIYVAGVANGKFCVARLNTSDGSLDANFGAAMTGLVTLSQTGQVKGMTIEARNAASFLVLVGPDGTGTKMAIARLTTVGVPGIVAGTPDPTFGPLGNGIETLSFGGNAEGANFVMEADFMNGSVYNEFDLLVGGFVQVSNPGSPSGTSCCSMVLALTDCQAGTTNAGVLDTANFGYNWVSMPRGGAGYTFANISCIAQGHAINGCCGTGYASNDNCYSLVCWTNANITPPPPNPAWFIYSVGPTDYTTANPSCSNQFSFVRYTQNGVRDTSWGTQGVVAIGSGPARPASLAIPYGATIETLSATYSSDPESDPTALIVAAGTGTYSSTGCDFILTRISVVDGSLDGTFGSTGQAYTDMTPSGTVAKNDIATSVLIDYTDFDIVVGGSTSYSTGQLAVARYRPNNRITVNAAGGAPRVAAHAQLAFSPQVPSLATAGPYAQPKPAPATGWTDPINATYEDPLLLAPRRKLGRRIALRVPGGAQ